MIWHQNDSFTYARMRIALVDCCKLTFGQCGDLADRHLATNAWQNSSTTIKVVQTDAFVILR